MASRKEFNGNTNGSEVAAAFADRIKGRTIPRGLEGDRVYLYKLDPALDSSKDGVYFADCQVAEAAKHAVDPEAARKLWDLSEKLTSAQDSVKL